MLAATAMPARLGFRVEDACTAGVRVTVRITGDATFASDSSAAALSWKHPCELPALTLARVLVQALGGTAAPGDGALGSSASEGHAEGAYSRGTLSRALSMGEAAAARFDPVRRDARPRPLEASLEVMVTSSVLKGRLARSSTEGRCDGAVARAPPTVTLTRSSPSP